MQMRWVHSETDILVSFMKRPHRLEVVLEEHNNYTDVLPIIVKYHVSLSRVL